MTDLSAEQLLGLRPEFYLQEGYRTARGEARPELMGLWALAAAHQLQVAGVAPEALEAGIRALRPAAMAQAESPLPLPDAPSLRAAVAGQPPAVRALLDTLIDGAHHRADLRPLLAHLGQILSMLALKRAMPRA